LRIRIATATAAAVGALVIWSGAAASATTASTSRAGLPIHGCSGSAITAVASGPMAEGTVIVYYLTLSNRGSNPCALPKRPALVVLLGTNGTGLPLASSSGSPIPGGRPLRTLAAKRRDTALTVVSWSNWCGGPQAVTGFQMRLRPASVGFDAEIPTSAAHLVPGCDSNPSSWDIAESDITASGFTEFKSPA
jgi:hypothetical protein